jgi:oligopeptide transport system substrate-binding protein
LSIRRTVWLIAAAMAAAATAGGCDPAAPNRSLAARAWVLHLCGENDVPTLDPAIGYDTDSWTFEQEIFDTLVRSGDANVDLQPDLAWGWTVSPDATAFSFRLRRDAAFTNGRPVTSADFKYAIERVLLPATRSKGGEYYRGISGALDFIAGRAKQVAGIDTPDDYTIVFRLDQPDPIFAHKLAMPFAAAVPREVVEKWGEDFSSHVVGSGPFKLREWIGGQRLVLDRNPTYFVKGQPRLDSIEYLVGVNQELQWLKYEAGELDVVTAIAPAEFPYLMKTPRLHDLTEHNLTVTTDYLGMNCQMAPFNDVRVRRAFNYAVNKNKLVAVINGRGVVAHGVLPPGLPGYSPDLKGYPYDPNVARALLDAVGLRHFAPVMWVRSDQTALMMAESVQQDLALVGVKVVLKPIAWGPLLEAIRRPKTVALFMLAWEADFPDPQNFLEVLLSRDQWGSNNDSFYDNPEVDALLREAAPIADLKKRYDLYRKAEKIVVADAPWVFLFNPVNYMIRQPWIEGYLLNPMRPSRLESVGVSPSGSPRD